MKFLPASHACARARTERRLRVFVSVCEWVVFFVVFGCISGGGPSVLGCGSGQSPSRYPRDVFSKRPKKPHSEKNLELSASEEAMRLTVSDLTAQRGLTINWWNISVCSAHH